MSNTSTHETEDARLRQQTGREGEHDANSDLQGQDVISPHFSSSLLAQPGIGKAANSPVRAQAIKAMQQTHGNRSVQRLTQKGSSTAANSMPHVQRAFWNASNLENDFWGTKELLGDRWGGVADAGLGAAWNLAGAIPGIGTPISAVGSIIDSGKSIASSAMGDVGAAEHFSNDSIASIAGAIPIWGTGQGAVTGLWDAANMVERIADPSAKQAPLSSDIIDEMIEY